MMITACLLVPLLAPLPLPQESMDFDPQMEVIDALGTKLRSDYAQPELGNQMAEHLELAFNSGQFEGLSRVKFGEVLTREMRSISHDGHLRILPGGRPTPDPASPWRPKSFPNHGFRSVSVLPHNVGYLDLTLFGSGPEVEARTDAAMALLSTVDALIIDLRSNAGGERQVVRHLSAYFFEEHTQLLSTIARGGKPEEMWTRESVPGKHMPKVPIYVLTSSFTFSAAEAFLFGLTMHDRVIVVGETTGGGGNFGGTVGLPAGFQVWMPVGYGFDPKTGKGWERTGITPNVRVRAEDAKSKAYAAACETLGVR